MRKSIISFLILCSGPLHAYSDSTTVRYDQSKIEWRQFDPEKMEQHKADDDFDYGNRPIPGKSLWQRFVEWLQRLLNKLLYMGTETPIGKVVIYIILAIIITYALLKLFKVDVRRVFYSSSDRGVMDFDVHHENIHAMDFDGLIKEAIDKKEFRNAIRLIYLASLKHLSDHQFIHWQAGKTNHEYMEEISEVDLKSKFGQLSYYFEYAWYGDFPISEGQFENVNALFTNWKKQLPQ
ncbi:MAG: DUF4129 domain-containing protein [Bacteroidota bacterium]